MIRIQSRALGLGLAFGSLAGFVLSSPFDAAHAEETAQSTASPALPGIPLTGRLFSNAYLPIRNPETQRFIELSTNFWLQGTPRLNDSSSATFIFTGRLAELGSSPTFQGGIREGYLQFAKAGWDVRVGKQIVPWGKSDAINPTDYLTAKDYRIFNPDDEVRRLGTWSLLTSFVPMSGNAPVQFTLYLAPSFPQGQLLLASSALPSSSSAATGSTVTINTTPQASDVNYGNMEIALKTAVTGSRWDASLSAFRGWNHTPFLSLTSLALTGPTSFQASITPVYGRLTAVGGDASFNINRFTFRAESSYFWTDSSSGDQPWLQPAHWDSVLGAETSFFSDFRVQLQGLLKYYPRLQAASASSGANAFETALLQEIAKTNALILAFQEKVRPSLTLRLGYTNDGIGLDAELFTWFNIIEGDFLFRPKVTYTVSDAIKATLGMDYYGGPLERPFGSLADYRSVFFEGKYTF